MNIPIKTFNAGELSPQIDARSDVEKYSCGCRHLENFIPRIYGSAERTPGTEYIETSYNDTETIRIIPFVYSATISYDLEFGEEYIRVFYNDAVVTTVTSPYQEADLFELQYKQVGDVMRIVHASHKPRKLIRTTATTFSLDEIDFRKGPFFLRNDLLDLNVTDTAFMQVNTTTVGSEGIMRCLDSSDLEVSFFDNDHLGALFKIVQTRDEIMSRGRRGTGGTGEICEAIEVKGEFQARTGGSWGGIVRLQRRQNSSSDDDWENYRSFDSTLSYSGGYFVGSNNYQRTLNEEEDNVEYRMYAEHVTGAVSASISMDQSEQTGIVKVTEVISDAVVRVEVLEKLASTDATKKWAEGAWSDYRGWPTSVTFLGERCIYAGETVVPVQI